MFTFLLALHALQVTVYIGLNIWIWQSYVYIPKKISENTDSGLMWINDAKLFVEFILWCGRHHAGDAAPMALYHAVMTICMMHMYMQGELLWLFYSGIVVYFWFLWLSAKTALVSHKARMKLRLNSKPSEELLWPNL